MSKTSEERAPLVSAAAALVDELAQYEKLTDEVSRAAVNSEKSLARATRAIQEASACHSRIMGHVTALSTAMAETRSRQENDLDRMAEAARKISERASTFQALVARYAALAETAKSINAQATDIASRKAAGADPREVLQSVGELLSRTGEVVDRSDEMATAARADDFDDMARSADALKQQLQSARNRLSLLQKTLAQRVPS